MDDFPIAITGGAASGKSTLLNMLREQGYRTEDADSVVRKLWHEPETLKALQKGLHLAGPPSKEEVFARIAVDDRARRAVNHIFHKPVLRVLLKPDLDFVEIPLLIETCSHPYFRAVWLADCPPEVQKCRLLARGKSESAALAMLEMQLSNRVRRCFADEIFDTGGPESALFLQIQAAISRTAPH